MSRRPAPTFAALPLGARFRWGPHGIECVKAGPARWHLATAGQTGTVTIQRARPTSRVWEVRDDGDG